MKAIVLFFSLVFALSDVYSQTSSYDGPPEVQIGKHNWLKVRIGWEKDPFRSAAEDYSDMRSRVSTERRPRSALEERLIRAAAEEKKPPTEPARYVFTYKLELQNTGSKAIKEIDWDYVFLDAVTGEEIGRREFTSVEKIGPGKRKDLQITVSSPPTKRVSAYTLGKNEQDGVIEKVFISRIMYEDDTAWQLKDR